MPEVLTQAAMYSAEEFLSADNLQKIDDTLTEVFGVMLGLEIELDPEAGADALEAAGDIEKVTSVIGFTGVARGSCVMSMSLPAALVIARAMMGGEPEPNEADDAIRDAASEICNLVVGGWKHRVENLQSKIMLAPPTVMTGRHYRIHGIDSSISLCRHYRFDGCGISLNLLMEKE